MLASLLVFFGVGLAALVALGLLLALIGLAVSAALALAGFLLFRVLPVVLVGYLVVRFLAPRARRLARTGSTPFQGNG